MRHEDTTGRIIDAAMKVHTALGAGLLESTYQTCLHYQFTIDGLHFEHQVRLPVVYQGVTLDAGYRIDFLVENCVIVSYLKLSGRPVGLLINFNVPHLRHGIKRIVSGYGPRTELDSPSVSPVSSVVESLKAAGNAASDEN